MGKGKGESDFQSKLRKDIEQMLPGSITLKQEDRYGIPDIIVLYQDRWALLECKKSKNEVHQPLQDYYIDCCNKMSFARFVYPENREEVLYELQQSFRS